MNTPSFWKKRGLIAWCLWPLSFFYPLIVYLRHAISRPARVDIPVICVGGLTAGGAGKTPTALHIGELCKQQGINAWFVSRGYKGKLTGPIQVQTKSHTSHDVGDEPLLLARCLPTIVAKDRLAGIGFAKRQGAQLIIADDGFQNPSLCKDLSFVVVDGVYGFGNGFTIPAGPLREWPDLAMKRADAVVMINPAPHSPSLPGNKPLLFAYITPDENALSLKDKDVLAFCGLATPQKFYNTLSSIGANIIKTKSYADHYAYSDDEIEALAKEAKAKQAILVTTAKDAARLPARTRALVTTVNISLRFENEEKLSQLMQRVMEPADE